MCQSSLPKNIAWLSFDAKKCFSIWPSHPRQTSVYCSVEVDIVDGATVREFSEMRRSSFRRFHVSSSHGKIRE